jgi:myosin-5
VPRRLSPNQIQKLLNQYLVADYEQPINGEIMKAVASRVTDPKSDVLLLQAVDMEDSGPYEIAEPRVITALETYTPSWLQTPRLKRLAEIVSAQAVMQQQLDAHAMGKIDEDGMDLREGEWPVPNGHLGNGHGMNGDKNGYHSHRQAAVGLGVQHHGGGEQDLSDDGADYR